MTLEVEEAMNAIQRQNQYLGHNEGRMQREDDIMVKEHQKANQTPIPANCGMLIQNYVSEENFWVKELIAGMQPIEGGEFVQRIITMGQFLLSKAIEKMPNNPYTGRIISKRFCKFVNDCVADTSMLKKRINFMRQTTPSQKAHALLYIMHQMFKHENRFA